MAEGVFDSPGINVLKKLGRNMHDGHLDSLKNSVSKPTRKLAWRIARVYINSHCSTEPARLAESLNRNTVMLVK